MTLRIVRLGTPRHADEGLAPPGIVLVARVAGPPYA
jgi:hypothetical protein